MREEAQRWWQQAHHDLDTAKKMFRAKIYYSSAFFCHQAAEKALKALIIQLRRTMPPKTRNLVLLAGEVKVPEKILSRLRLLNPEYVASRYPNAANAVPAENYDAPKTRMLLRAAGEVMKWATSELERPS